MSGTRAIIALMLLKLVFGFVGLLPASPLTATTMTLIKMLYIEDMLADSVMIEGGRAERRAEGEPV